MVKVVYVELLRLEDCVFLSILKTCGLIRRKKDNGKMILSIKKDKWILFICQYDCTMLKLLSLRLVVLLIGSSFLNKNASIKS